MDMLMFQSGRRVNLIWIYMISLFDEQAYNLSSFFSLAIGLHVNSRYWILGHGHELTAQVLESNLR